MKSIIGILLFTFAFTFANAQTKKVKERDLKGTWQMKIDLGEDFLEEDIEDEDNILARMILSATSSFVTGLMDELDLRFEFLDDNVCKIYVSVFDSDAEVEYADWRINDRGQLFISDTDSFNMDSDEYWVMEDGLLVAKEDGENITDDGYVYMYKLD